MKYDDSAFRPDQIDAAYINSLVNLVNACRVAGVEMDKVFHFQNGWLVTFKGFEGADAICHDGSYGSPCYMAGFLQKGHDNDWTRSGDWETSGFPWDYDDMSVHSAQELALYISALKNGTNIWEHNEDEDEDC